MAVVRVKPPIAKRRQLALSSSPSGTLALVVVGKHREEIGGFLTVHAQALADHVDELVVVTNPGGKFGSLAAIGNRYFRLTQSSVFGLVHADTGFRQGALGVFKREAEAGKVCGIVGRPLDGRYVWAHAGGGNDITCLDGCAIFFRRSHSLSFDEKNFDGYHCAVEDAALLARSQGLSLFIPDAKADHASTSNFRPGMKPGNPEWLKDYYEYAERLKKKWSKLDYLLS